MESRKMDEGTERPVDMEQQNTSESEEDNTQLQESSRVAIVNNEHADSKGAGPEHMANSGAGVTEDGIVVEANFDTAGEHFEVSDDMVTSHMPNDLAFPSDSMFETEQDNNSNFSNMHEVGAYQEEDIIDTDSEERKIKEKFNVETLGYELQVGYRILSNLMSASNRCVNKLFLYPVDDTFPETADYYEKIKEPMWMFKMKEKFERHEYGDLPQFMADFRLMIENCYRFNGPDNFVSKKAQKLETMMKQKVALLSRDLREKISGSALSNSDDDLLASAGLRRRVRNPNISADDPSQQLLSQLRRDRELQEKVDRRQKVEDRKAMEQARAQELQDWEDSLLDADVKEHIRTMWELPQIGLFVYLCMESLGLEEEVTQYQLERGLAAPRECSDFRRLMTCLLSTPHQRKSLKSFMPYQVWNAKLSKKLDYLYKVLADKQGNQIQACYLLGLDTRAFKVMGKRNPLLKKQFHELSYLKRVWILKNYCDFCMETQPYLQKTIEDIEVVRPMDVREVPLGSDGKGNRYINFPMFTGKDIRIYKHSKHGEPSLESLHMEDWSVDAEKMTSAASSRCSTPVNPRSSRLAETPSTSLRARALLQAAESKEASPMRDTSRSGSEAPDTNSSTPLSNPPRSGTPDAVKGKQSSTKKRKRTSLFFSKRKRLKPGSKKVAGNGKGGSEDREDQGEENEEEVEGVPESVSSGSLPSRAEEEKSAKDTEDSVCDVIDSAKSSRGDKSTSSSGKLPNGSTEVPGDKTPSAAVKTEPQSAMDVDDSESYPKNSVKTQANGSSSASSCLNGPESSSSKHADSKQHDSAYLSSESNKSLIDEENIIDDSQESSTVIVPDVASKETDSCLNLSGSATSQATNERTTSVVNGVKHNNTSADSNLESQLNYEAAVKRSELSEDGVKTKDSTQSENQCQKDAESKDSTASNSETKIKEEMDFDEQIVATESKAMCDEIKNETVELSGTGETTTVINNHGDGQDIKVRSEKLVSCKEEEGTKVEKGGDSQPKEETKEGDSALAEMKTGVKEEIEDVAPKPDEDEEEEDSDEEDLPDRGRVELVAESMEEIRQLMKKLSNPDPIKRGKRVYPGVMKPCEEELLNNLTVFHDELLKYERNLTNARIGMQTKLRKEVESYVEPKVEEAKGWDSDHSQSTKDSSDDEEDSDSKADTDSAKQSKKAKPKSSTTALLSSAASKLSALSGEGNEDSNDSFELDISSRGRLRKRRIIPNNTEDTGLKKRKNLPNQDSFFSSASSTAATSTVSTGTGTVTQATMPTVVQRQPGKPWPSHIISMLTSGTSNSAIKAQLAAQTSRTSGQIVRLVAPGADGAIKALRVAGKPNMIISPQSLSNIRFISSTGVVTLPRNRVVASSSAQSSHPVIQQLLLNQTRPAVQSSVTSATTRSSGSTSALLQKHLSGVGITSQPAATSTMKVSVVITAPSAVSTVSTSKPSLVIPAQPASGAVVVTQVSTSVSQGGKQVLDLGSLTVTQLQQLMKNQAIQINTGAGNPTTLFLTTGLQHLTTPRTSGAATSQAAMAGGVSATQVRVPLNQATLQAKPGVAGASSLLAMINKAQRPQILLNNKLNPLLTLSRQVSPQMIRPPTQAGQSPSVTHVRVNTTSHVITTTVINQGLNNAALQTALARTISLVPPTMGTIMSAVNQQSLVTKPTSISFPSNLTQVVTTQKPLVAPRIISSLAASTAAGVPVGAAAVSSSSQIANSNPWALSSDSVRSRIINIPLAQVISPSKKYASNVTVKALLENRGTKKGNEEESCENETNGHPAAIDGQDSEMATIQDGVHDNTASGTNVTVTSTEEEEAEDEADGRPVLSGTKAATETVSKSVSGATIIKTLQTANTTKEISQTAVAITAQVNTATSVTLQKSTIAALNAHSLPLSVDTAIQSVTPVTTSEIILPTMNIKVPSPNTLPSVQHNKNGTTIVQSTKVPIQVASEAKTGDSLSPSATIAPLSISHAAALQSNRVATKIQTVANNNIVIVPTPASTVQLPSANPVLPGTTPPVAVPKAGLKNVTLKVTPQNGGSGQFVQGYMTSRGLVIPQTAFLPQQSSNVILAGSSQPGAVAQLQGNQVKIQPSPMLGVSNHQNVLSIASSGLAGTASGQQIQQQQQPQKVVVAAPDSVMSSGQSSTTMLAQNANPNLKFLFLNRPAVSAGQSAATTATMTITSQQQQHTSTPAAELVKQIANNSQVQAGSQQQKAINPSSVSPGSGQQNTVQLLNNLIQGAGIQQNTGATIQTVGGLPTQNLVNSQTGVSPQLAAQILALQQNSQLQQQQQPNIVLTAKPAQSQGLAQPQNKPSVVTLQLQQLGQLFSNVGGVTQLQVGGATQQVASIQQQLGTRMAQPNQVLQLAINPSAGSQTILAAPQAPQVVRVGTNQLSPQLQLASQGVAQIQQIQPNGSIVIHQQPTLVPQQQSQSIILQQPSLSQSVMGPNSMNIQSAGSQTQLSTLQHQLSKITQQSIPKPQTPGNKVQPGTGNLPQGQQLIGASQTPGLVISQLQTPAVTLSSSTVTQPQVQFLISPSNASVPSLSIAGTATVSPSIGKIPLGTVAGTGNINRVIRADSALVQPNVNSQNSGMLGLSSAISPTNGANQTLVIGNSVSNKPAPQMIIPNSGTGQYLISPVKLAPQNPQANIVSPVKLVRTQTPSSVLGQTSTQLVVNNQLANPALAGLQTQVPVNPAVIYAGQQAPVTEKKEGKIAQILLSQPISKINSGPSQIVVNSHQNTGPKLPVSLSPSVSMAMPKLAAADSNASLSSKTFLYKIGDQYFSPAGSISVSNVQQVPMSSGILTSPGTTSTSSKSDVQLLVPPAFIEASDQILKQNTKTSSTQASVPQLTVSSSPSASGGVDSSHPPTMQKAARRSPGVKDSSSSASLHTPGSVNGIHQGSTQFSFSLSGPSSLNSKQLPRPVAASAGVPVAGQTLSSAITQQGSGAQAPPSRGTSLSASEVTVSSSRGPAENKVTPRRNTFSGSQDIATGSKGQTPQRHLSVDESALTTEERDEKEAALNLLTLANQQI